MHSKIYRNECHYIFLNSIIIVVRTGVSISKVPHYISTLHLAAKYIFTINDVQKIGDP